MSFLNTVKTNFINGTYDDERNVLIKVSEDNDIFTSRLTIVNIGAKVDSVDHAVIGYGFDLLENSPSVLVDFLSAVNSKLGTSITLSSADLTLLNQYHAGTKTAQDVESNLQLELPDEAYASGLLDELINTGTPSKVSVEKQVTDLFKLHFAGVDIAPSRERAALVSLVFNGNIGLISNKLLTAIKNDNRAEA